VGLIAWGEGWHNNHHAFQRSARHGLAWWELDLTWWTIRGLAALGLVRDIQLLPKNAEQFRIGSAEYTSRLSDTAESVA
jgi:stearoyl-CoA desaturase (delta-9 desaturase)